MQITIGRGNARKVYELPNGNALQAMHRNTPGEFLTLRNNICALAHIPGFEV